MVDDEDNSDPKGAMPQGTETILHIEDEEAISRLVETLLTSYGYAVLEAKDGQEGWEIFTQKQNTIDLVLLDLSLPNLSGQELLAQILVDAPETKVIIVTGYLDYTAESLGARALLQKPYPLIQALHTIREVLDE